MEQCLRRKRRIAATNVFVFYLSEFTSVSIAVLGSFVAFTSTPAMFLGQHAPLLESDNASPLAARQIFFDVQDARSQGSDKISRLAARQRIFEGQNAPFFFFNPTKHLVRQHARALSRDSPQFDGIRPSISFGRQKRNLLFAFSVVLSLATHSWSFRSSLSNACAGGGKLGFVFGKLW